MCASRCLKYKILLVSPYRVGNKKRCRETCIVLVRKRTASRREPHARGRRSLIRTSIRSLSRLTKPHLALSYLTSFAVPVRRVLQCLASPRNPFVSTLARSRALLRVAQIPLSLVATALLQSSPHIHTLKKSAFIALVEKKDVFETKVTFYAKILDLLRIF